MKNKQKEVSECCGKESELHFDNPKNQPQHKPVKVCSGCGKFFKPKTKWEEEFDKRFPDEVYHLRQLEVHDKYNNREYKEMAAKDIKQFISSLLASKVKETEKGYADGYADGAKIHQDTYKIAREETIRDILKLQKEFPSFLNFWAVKVEDIKEYSKSVLKEE